MRLCARRIKTHERIHVIHFGDGGVGIADADGHTGDRVGEVHDRKAGKIGSGGRRLPGLYVDIRLRPSQAENAAQETHKTILDVRQLRAGGGADSIDDDECVNYVSRGTEVVGATVDRVGKAVVHASRAGAEERIGNGAVVVVDDADGSSGGGREDIGGAGDRAQTVRLDVAAVDVFGEMPGLGCNEGHSGDCGPCAEGCCYKGVGLRTGEDRAEISLIGEVLHRAIRPDERLAFDSGIVAGAGDEGGASGAGRGGNTEQKDGEGENSNWGTHGTSSDPLISSGSADGALQLKDANAIGTGGLSGARRLGWEGYLCGFGLGEYSLSGCVERD